MIRPSTLRGQLALSAFFSTAVLVGLLTVAFNVIISAQLRAGADDVLRTRATAAAGLIEVSPQGTLTVHESGNDEALDANIWIYQGERALDRPVASVRLQREADALARSLAHGFVQTKTGPATRLYALPVGSRPRRRGTVVAAIDVEPYDRAAGLALWGSAAFAVLLLGSTYLGMRAVATRALRPVEEMTRRAADWSAHDVEHRFGSAIRPAELTALAATLDELLARQSALVRHERQLSAELSHELRTPLSLIIAETDLLASRHRTEAETRHAHTAIATSAERMSRIIETLLSAARARISEAPGRCSALSAIHGTVQHLQASTPGPSFPIAYQADPELMVGLSVDIAERILTPLLDNALRYAVATVEVSAAPRDGEVEISVHDDGPGVPQGVEEAIFEPGCRADPRDGHSGAGLGLALARRLARAAGGDIRVVAAEAGSTFTVRLPPA
jgi:signal transduction histidine kinase